LDGFEVSMNASDVKKVLVFGAAAWSLGCGGGEVGSSPSEALPRFTETEGQSTSESPGSATSPAVQPSGEGQTPTGLIPAQTEQEPQAALWTPPTSVDPNTPVGQHGQLRVDGTRLADRAGAPLQLKGISTMWLNWEDEYSTSKAGLQWMRDNWKISLIRAAMGVEEQNSYLTNREGMTEQVRTVVHNAIDLGLYVLIDWHSHAAEMSVEQSKQFFGEMAEEFGSFPNVLYETYNEPIGMEGAWATAIKPYHEQVIPVIRAADPDSVIVLGSRQWSQRVDEAAADPVLGDNLMYTLHFYACTHGQGLRDLGQQAINAGLALFVTEWGATNADGGTPRNPGVCADEATLWHDWMDERQVSWAAWKLDDCVDTSCLFRAGAPKDGGWTSEWLNGHAEFVINRLSN
jgi:endoglucanase